MIKPQMALFEEEVKPGASAIDIAEDFEPDAVFFHRYRSTRVREKRASDLPVTKQQTALFEEEDQPVVSAIDIADEFGPNAGIFYRYRSAKAREKAAREEAEGLRPEICELLDNGELVGIEGAGYLTYQLEERVTFDWQAAMDSGLFTPEQAEAFFKRSTVQKLVSRRWGA